MIIRNKELKRRGAYGDIVKTSDFEYFKYIEKLYEYLQFKKVDVSDFPSC